MTSLSGKYFRSLLLVLSLLSLLNPYSNYYTYQPWIPFKFQDRDKCDFNLLSFSHLTYEIFIHYLFKSQFHTMYPAGKDFHHLTIPIHLRPITQYVLLMSAYLSIVRVRYGFDEGYSLNMTNNQKKSGQIQNASNGLLGM